jgi:hypothetical protein
MASNIPITNGQGQSSVAAEEISGLKYQVIKIVGGETGSTSVMGVNPDRSINVSVIGQVQMTGSVQTIGSVVAYQGGAWATSVISGNASIITRWADSSVIAIAAGSVVAVPVGSTIAVIQANSIAGTYAEDVAHTAGANGLFALGVRNDTLASVTSADNDYSQISVGPSGETVVADAPFTRWISGVADLRVVQGASVTAIAAQGASVFTYVREVQVANFGSASVLVKIAGGLGSTLGWTIAPAGGGSNFVTRYKTGENSAVTASINGTASVLVTISGFTARI